MSDAWNRFNQTVLEISEKDAEIERLKIEKAELEARIAAVNRYLDETDTRGWYREFSLAFLQTAREIKWYLNGKRFGPFREEVVAGSTTVDEADRLSSSNP